MIDQNTIDEAVRILMDAAPAGSEVILFGSYARGEVNEDSDLDFLVVEPTLGSRRDEMVRLRMMLKIGRSLATFRLRISRGLLAF